jgi:small subunit ribosomal protein S6
MAESPLYDLLLLLSSDAPEEQRTRVLALVESAIAQGGGSIERNDNWGRRPMAYQIRHQPEAEYHLLQFRAPGSIIEELSHTLRITDGVLRFRIIKVRRGTPAAKSSPPPVVAAVAATPSSFGGPSERASSEDSGSVAPQTAASDGGGGAEAAADRADDQPAEAPAESAADQVADGAPGQDLSSE